MAKKPRGKFMGQTSNTPSVVTVGALTSAFTAEVDDDMPIGGVVTDEDGAEDTRFDKKNLCSGCGANFLSVKAFDAHRVGDYGGPIYKGSKMVGFKESERRCLTALEMAEKGLESKPGFLAKYDDGKIVAGIPVISWFFPVSEKDRKRFARMRQKRF